MRLFIGIPCTGWVNTELVKWLYRHASEYETVLFSIDGFKDTNANKVIWSFIKSGCDMLLMMDSDIIPDDGLIKRLSGFKKDIVAGIPPIFNIHEKRFKVGAFRRKKKAIESVGYTGKLEEVDTVGGACLMMKKSALKKIGSPWFRIEVGPDGVQRVGADVYFSKKAREKGFKLYADCSWCIGHKSEVDLADILESFSKLLERPLQKKKTSRKKQS